MTTDTTGNYVGTVTAGTGLTSTGATSGEGIAHSLSVDASQTQITAVGTIGTGVWNGTAIASAYLDADTAQLSGTQTFSGAKTFSSNITVGGTVDGRDVAADGTKLDGIEASATADQSNAEIRTAVEAATDSNVFTDADHSKLNAIEASATADQTNAEIVAAVEAGSDSNTFTDADHSKLNAIEASADVTDTANVTSSGALMDSELTDLAGVKGVTISTLQYLNHQKELLQTEIKLN